MHVNKLNKKSIVICTLLLDGSDCCCVNIFKKVDALDLMLSTGTNDESR